MKKIGLLIFVFTCNILYAQQSVIDSLKILLSNHHEEDSAHVMLLIKTGDALRYTDLGEALVYTQKALSLAEKISWQFGKASSYRQLGAIALAKSDDVSAIDFFYKALKVSEPLKNRKFDGGVYNNLGIIYTNMGQFDKAVENYKKMLDVARELNLKKEESLTLMNIGRTYQKMHESEKAMSYLKQSLKIAEDSSYIQIAAYALDNIGIVIYASDDYENALIAFRKSIDYSIKAGDISIQSESLAGLGQSYYKLKDYSKAEMYSNQALEIAIQSNSIVYQSEIHHLLSDVYKDQNKFDQALDHYQKFITLRDSIVNNEKKTEIAKKVMQFEFDRKEAIAKAEVSQQRLVKNFTLAGAAILLVAFISSFIFYKRRRDSEEQKKESDFRALVSETEMKALRSQMNPHFIFNSLNSINDYISKNDLKSADLYLTKFSKVMRLILENSERKQISLSDDVKVLELYMQLESLRLKNKFSYEIIIDENIDKENTLVPPLILQPYVENSIWHGLSNKQGVGKILIQIKREGNMINCIVEDNGIGRAQSEILNKEQIDLTKKSLGMKITKARIDIINKIKKSNARIELSDLVEGLRVEIRLPLELSF